MYSFIKIEQISLSLSSFFTLQIPEYCQSLDEFDVLDNAFELIFAFDEIVALGYRESVNLAQIRTFTEMDSHEERVFEAMRKVSFEGHCMTFTSIMYIELKKFLVIVFVLKLDGMITFFEHISMVLYL